MEHGPEYESKESWSNLVDLVCGFFFFFFFAVVGWFFFLFFLLWLVVIWFDCY